MGLMLAAYFSAILSTADSCLMAASGNVQTDILDRIFKPAKGMKAQLRISQIITLAIGVLALVLAHSMSNVLELMLYSYAFMVSGLFVPILAALYTRKPKAAAALPAMIAGGSTTILLILFKVPLPFGLNENIFGITVSAVVYILIYIFTGKSKPILSNP
jgi:SSS family solute:Na+ symporter